MDILRKYFSNINQGTFDMINEPEEIWRVAYSFLTENEADELFKYIEILLKNNTDNLTLFNLVNSLASDVYLIDPEETPIVLQSILDARTADNQ